jgi:UDP-glucose 4-epimerase
MRVLITGANGFLGRHVVAAVAARGHHVRALVRSANAAAELQADMMEPVVCDLRSRSGLPGVLDEIDAVIHLAASVKGSDDLQFMNTVVGTENLLDAVAAGGVDRFVHCSSFSVYDWKKASSTLDEDSPLEADRYARDGYAVAKIWQEELVRRYAAKNDWRLTVLRPGFLWGPGNEMISGTGHSFGRCHVVFGGARQLPISYVENCAECIALALDQPAAVGETYNIVDPERISAWRYTGEALRATKTRGFRLYVPYWIGLAAATAATWFGRLILGPSVKLPGLLVSIRYRARFRPLHFTSHKAQLQLDWHPRYSFAEAWQRIANQAAATSTASRQSAASASPREVAVE